MFNAQYSKFIVELSFCPGSKNLGIMPGIMPGQNGQNGQNLGRMGKLKNANVCRTKSFTNNVKSEQLFNNLP
jgi:hypothetical protein